MYQVNIILLLTFMVAFILESIDEEPIRVVEVVPHTHTLGAYCLANNIYFEARDQSVVGQYAVALVTINRVKDKRFPDNVCDVVYQRRQFSWTNSMKNDVPEDKKAFDVAMRIAHTVLNYPVVDLTQGALYYHNTSVKPYWSIDYTWVDQIEDHIFYRRD